MEEQEEEGDEVSEGGNEDEPPKQIAIPDDEQFSKIKLSLKHVAYLKGSWLHYSSYNTSIKGEVSHKKYELKSEKLRTAFSIISRKYPEYCDVRSDLNIQSDQDPEF